MDLGAVPPANDSCEISKRVTIGQPPIVCDHSSMERQKTLVGRPIKIDHGDLWLA